MFVDFHFPKDIPPLDMISSVEDFSIHVIPIKWTRLRNRHCVFIRIYIVIEPGKFEYASCSPSLIFRRGEGRKGIFIYLFLGMDSNHVYLIIALVMNLPSVSQGHPLYPLCHSLNHTQASFGSLNYPASISNNISYSLTFLTTSLNIWYLFFHVGF